MPSLAGYQIIDARKRRLKRGKPSLPNHRRFDVSGSRKNSTDSSKKSRTSREREREEERSKSALRTHRAIWKRDSIMQVADRRAAPREIGAKAYSRGSSARRTQSAIAYHQTLWIISRDLSSVSYAPTPVKVDAPRWSCGVAQLHFRCFPGYRCRCRARLKAKLMLSHRCR